MKLDWHSSVVVTGGSGFVGGALVKRLLGQGCKVRVISRFLHIETQAELRRYQQRPDQLEWHQGDLGHPSGVGGAFANATHVFHVAALVDLAAPPVAFEGANIRATEIVCEMSVQAGISRLVYVSTCDVFGLPRDGEVITERSPYRAWNEPYPDSKIKAAEIVKFYRGKGLSSTIIYPGWVYGPGDRAFFPALFRHVSSGLVLNWSPKGFEIHLVFVDDLVDAIMQAADDEVADNNDFLILDDASGVEMSDLIDQIASYFGVTYKSFNAPYRFMYGLAWTAQFLVRLGIGTKPMLTTADVKSFGHTFRYSAAKARDVLGWSPRTSFHQGIKAALQWQAENLVKR